MSASPSRCVVLSVPDTRRCPFLRKCGAQSISCFISFRLFDEEGGRTDCSRLPDDDGGRLFSFRRLPPPKTLSKDERFEEEEEEDALDEEA